MTNIWVRPFRPEDMPTLKAWMEEQRTTTPFDPALARGALLLVAYDDSGVLGFFPAWPALTAGCPLERVGLGDPLRARTAQAVVQQLAFLAERHGALEVNTATSDEGTEWLLCRLGFKVSGKFMRRRHGV